MSYVILTDCNCDLSPELIKKLDVEIIPMPCYVDGKQYMSYPDGRDIKIEEFYRLQREGKETKTAAPNPSDFLDILEPMLKEGKDVLCIAFSSALSCTYVNCGIAITELRGKYPERKLVVVDSLCASMGQGLLVALASDKRAEGLTIEENTKWLEENKLSVCHWFTVNDLFHLKRGGKNLCHLSNTGKRSRHKACASCGRRRPSLSGKQGAWQKTVIGQPCKDDGKNCL